MTTIIIVGIITFFVSRRMGNPTYGKDMAAVSKRSNAAYPWIPVPPNITTYIWIENVRYRATAHRTIKDAAGGSVKQYKYLFAPNREEIATLYPGQWMYGTEESSHFGMERNIYVFSGSKDAKDYQIEKITMERGILKALLGSDAEERLKRTKSDAAQKVDKSMEELAQRSSSLEGLEPGGLDTTGMSAATAQALRTMTKPQ